MSTSAFRLNASLLAGMAVPLATTAVLIAGCGAPADSGLGSDIQGPSALGPGSSTSASATAEASATQGATPHAPSSPTGLSSLTSNQPAVVIAVRAVPDRVDPLACTPPDPPERPLVIAEVWDPDSELTSLVVRLSYDSGTGNYTGDVRMVYDSAHRYFTYRLPAVTARSVRRNRGGIGLMVSVQEPVPPAKVTPPTSGFILLKSYCLGEVENGPQ